MNLKNVITDGIYRLYADKRAVALREEAMQGLEEKDWQALYHQMYTIPREDEIKAPNEDHVKLYDNDIRELEEIKKLLEEQVRAEIPEYEFIHFFDGGIMFHSHTTPLRQVLSTKKMELTFSEKLLDAKNFLAEWRTGLDLTEFLSFAHSTIYECIDESKKNVRIAQKGKTGEEHFSRILAGYKHKYHALENIVIPAAEGDGLTSETDTYIVTSKGVFVCEVKNYGKAGQTLAISEDDRWYIFDETGRLLNTKMSATAQNERHCRATKAFFEKYLANINIPIIPVVVIANDEVEISNASKSPVIYAKEIENFIEQYQDCLSSDVQGKIVKAFNDYKLDMVDYPVKLNQSRGEHAKMIQEEVIPYAKANAKIANGIFELRKKSNLIANAVIVAIGLLLALLCIKNGLLVALEVVSLFFACFSFTTLGFVCGTVSMIAWILVELTQIPLITLIAILALIGAFYFSAPKKN